MSQAEDVNPGADQEKRVDTSWFDMEIDYIMRRKIEIWERLDAISLEGDELHHEHLSMQAEGYRFGVLGPNPKLPTVEELAHLLKFMGPEDWDEGADTDIGMRRLQTEWIAQKSDAIARRLNAIPLEKSRLDQEEAELRQEEASLKERFEDLRTYDVPSFLPDRDNPEPDEDDLSLREYSVAGDAKPLDGEMSLALSQRASALCSICRNFPRGRFINSEGEARGFKVYHPFLSSLKRSVDGGCCLCEEVAKSLERFLQKSDPPATKRGFWSIRCKITFQTPWQALLLWFILCQCELGHPDNVECKNNVELGSMSFLPLKEMSGGLGPEFLDPTLKTSSADSAASVDVARSWYQRCLNHATCRDWRREKRALPTRLIQISGSDNGSADLSARLCDTKDLPITTPYVSLSHCWGKCVLFKLMQSNLEDLRQEIPIRQLPKVFQDAIYITFKLGISYLWIDSICIIQDSKEDWTNEAKRMGDVYLHGEFNISATAYKDGSSGLFDERKALSLKNYPLYVDFTLVEKGPDWGVELVKEGFYVRWDFSEFHDKIANGFLFSRAWVAQERALSPAILHYTREQIWWECNQEILNEAVPESSKIHGKLIWDEAEGSGQDRIRSLSKQSDPEQVYLFWRTFIAQHSGDLLTFQRDRFPAIAGMARILGDIIDDDLVAGFWSGDLIRSLTMTRGPPRQAIQPELIAPTWSWASLCSATGFPGKSIFDLLSPLKGVHVIKVLSDVPGFKSDLHSTHFEKSAVRGLVIRGVLRRLPDWFKSHLDAGEWIGDPTLPILMSDVDAASDHVNPWCRGEENIPEEQKWRLKRPTHMLLLATGRDSILEHEFVKGLLVQTAEMDEPNTFRRTGTIEFDSQERMPDWEECFGLGTSDVQDWRCSWLEERGLQDIVLI